MTDKFTFSPYDPRYEAMGVTRERYEYLCNLAKIEVDAALARRRRRKRIRMVLVDLFFAGICLLAGAGWLYIAIHDWRAD